MRMLASQEFKFDPGTSEVSGYGAVFNNVDRGGDRIQPGAFTDSLAAKAGGLPMLAHHDPTRPIGVWSEVSEDKRGLKVAGRISATADGRDVRTLAKDGAVTGLSIGYWPKDTDIDQNGNRVLKSVDLLEVSLVTFPMNDLARISAVKSQIAAGQTPSEDDIALLLRNSGLSRRATRKLLDRGYTGLSKQHQAVEVLDRLHNTLRKYL